MSEIQTSYYLVENGKPNGPYNMLQLSELKEQGRLTPDTYVWQEGMQNWAFAKNRTDLKSLFSEVLPPPIPSIPGTEPATEPTSDEESEYLIINGEVYKDFSEAKISGFSLRVLGVDKEEIRSVTIPTCVKKIDDSTFYDCKLLKKVSIPSSVTIMGDRCFCDCNKLESVLLPPSIASIGLYAFSGCSSLKKIDLSRCTQLEDIEMHTFDECNKLESVLLPPSITSIGNGAFMECSSLKEIDLSRCTKLETIGSCAFSGCTSLNEIDLSRCILLENIVGNHTFFQCQRLESILFPPSLKEIGGNYPFALCKNLKTLSFPNGMEQISFMSFVIFNSSIHELFFPASMKKIEGIDTIRSTIGLDIYCFAPKLEKLSEFAREVDLYVLPEYLESYKSQAEAEGKGIRILPMPDEYLYYYDN